MLSDCRNCRLLQDIGITESNGIVIIVARGLEIAALCACACTIKMWKKSTKNVAKSSTFRNFYRKLMPLRTTVMTEFRPEVQVMAFLHMHKKTWWKTVLNAIRSSKFSALIKSRACRTKWHCQNCSQTLVNCLFCECALRMGKNNKTLLNHQYFSTDHRKLMSLKTTVTTESRNYAISAHVQRKWANTAVRGTGSSKYSTSTNRAKKHKIAEITQTLHTQLT